MISTSKSETTTTKCDTLLDKCAVVVQKQQKTIESQTVLIDEQKKVIAQKDEDQKGIKTEKRVLWITNVLTVIGILLLL